MKNIRLLILCVLCTGASLFAQQPESTDYDKDILGTTPQTPAMSALINGVSSGMDLHTGRVAPGIPIYSYKKNGHPVSAFSKMF